VVGRGYQNIITTDLVEDPILTDNNIRYFKKMSKELYNFTLVRHDDSSAMIRCRVACLNLSPYAGCDQALAIEIQKTEGSHDWPPGARCKGKSISEELTKNVYLQTELDKLKLERMRETWLLKNDLRNLEKANSELQEQLKEQKKAHQGSPFFPRVLSLDNLSRILKISSPQSLGKS
jgi:hypothetical protein